MPEDVHQPSESGLLPGRYQWTVEPNPMEVPEDPEWEFFSDRMRQWTAQAGAVVERDEALGTADADGHSRGTEEPEATISYDMQRFPVDENGDPVSAEGHAAERDNFQRINNTLLAVGRTEDTGGNFDAGMRTYTVIRSLVFETLTANLDPSEAAPILLEAEVSPKKIRSYICHQIDEPQEIEVTSTHPDDDDGIEVTIESEDAETSETIEIGGQTTDTFTDVDTFWIHEPPVGDISFTAGNDIPVVDGASYESDSVIAGGLTYSDDDQPLDGDQGVPALNEGSNAEPINETFEYFMGDRMEREIGVPFRPRINSAEWIIENTVEDESLHRSRAPSNDVGNRNVQVTADVAGKRASHDSIMDSLQKTSFPLAHQLSGGVVYFPSLVVQEGGEREYEADDQAMAAVEETLEATDGGGIEFHQNATIEDILGD